MICEGAWTYATPTMTAVGERLVCSVCGATWHAIPGGWLPRHERPGPSVWTKSITDSKGTP